MKEQLTLSKSSPLKARFYDYEHFTYPWHFHSEYEIIYIKESTGIRFVSKSIEAFAPGDIFLIGPNVPHYMKSNDRYHSKPCELRAKGTIIQFEEEFMQHAIDHYPHFIKIKNLLNDSQQGVYFPAGCSSNLPALMDQIPGEIGMPQMLSFLSLLKEMSETPERKLINTPDMPELPTVKVSRMDRVLSFINNNYTRQILLEEVASVAAMHPTSFCRYFKEHTGKTFVYYLMDMRLAYACKLLLMNKMNISQIASDCGFDTLSHFNNQFKKAMGYTPSQYRKIMLDDL